MLPGSRRDDVALNWILIEQPFEDPLLGVVKIISHAQHLAQHQGTRGNRRCVSACRTAVLSARAQDTAMVRRDQRSTLLFPNIPGQADVDGTGALSSCRKARATRSAFSLAVVGAAAISRGREG